MANTFITKRLHKKYIRPVRNRSVKHNVTPMPEEVSAAENSEKEENTNTDMNANQIEALENVLGATKDMPTPRRRVKVDKKDKGLLERTSECTTLLTEDGRTLLND